MNYDWDLTYIVDGNCPPLSLQWLLTWTRDDHNRTQYSGVDAVR